MTTAPFYAVLGQPIAHSRSPRIHAAFAAQFGLPLRYEAIAAPVDGFAATLRQLRDQGLQGCNVTLPFKPEALALADAASERARRAGAANTLGWSAEGRLWADNTDGQGLCQDLAGAGLAVRGRRLLLLGAGGAAAGCLAPLMAAAPASIHISNRSADKVWALIERHADLGVPLHALAWGAADALPFDGVINATSAALGGTALQLPAHLFAPGAWALDMVYGPAAAPFLAAARAQGAQGRDGLGMLVAQAALAFARWHGQTPATAPVFNALRAEVTQP